MSLDPHIKAMIDATTPPPGGPPLDDVPADMVRAGYVMLRTSQDTTKPMDVVAKDMQVGGGSGTVPARLYTPPGAAATTPGLVYFHGGGFVIGNLETHDGLCRRFAKLAGIRVLSVDYRLAPEHPYPAGHDDALAATQWAFDHAAEIGFDPTRIAVGGDSAGGNLAAVISHDMRNDHNRRLAFQLLLYPAVAMDSGSPSRLELDGPVLTKEAMTWFEKHLGVVGHPDAGRMTYNPQWELKRLPPAHVVTAGWDPLKDEGRGYADDLNAAGIKATHKEYPTLVHDFFLMHDVSPVAAQAITETAVVLKAALG